MGGHATPRNDFEKAYVFFVFRFDPLDPYKPPFKPINWLQDPSRSIELGKSFNPKLSRAPQRPYRKKSANLKN